MVAFMFDSSCVIIFLFIDFGVRREIFRLMDVNYSLNVWNVGFFRWYIDFSMIVLITYIILFSAILCVDDANLRW